MFEPTLNYLLCPDANGGHRMAYWQWGNPDSAHVVLCVHGLSRQGRDFDVLAQALCEKSGNTLRVVCPDVAGRGQSDWLPDPAGYQIPSYAADMLALIAQIEPDTLDWVGTSMGGLIGMVVAGQAGIGSAAPAVVSVRASLVAGPPQGETAPSGGSAAHAVASVGASLVAGPPQGETAPLGGSAAHAVASVGATAIRRLVLNDVGPVIQWQSLQRIGEYLGQTGEFAGLQHAADALAAVSTTFGPHTPAQWLALSRHMVRSLDDTTGRLTLHYDPAIAVPFRTITQESVAQSEAMLWHLYDNIDASTLLTRGAQSDLLSRETARAMAGRGPKARLIEFEGVGHAPTFVADDQVQAVTSFLLD